ncbi:MAG TPA: sugar ABC transporter ATP-binding protein [Roseiflexaceae bacterium]|nr:sugar ABC transporter ATP-binding protein [Roseiflexaceae bacterium]
MDHPTTSVLVRMEGITKRFPGVQALDSCGFELRAGEVHALLGENGAGKSTLMKILAGILPQDTGTISHKGERVEISSPRAALLRGIAMIHQELNLIPHLTVAQNIWIGREPRRWLRLGVDDREINRRTQQLFDTLHLQLDPRSSVAALSVAKQQLVEIAKALSRNADVLIMDEPTAALTETEIDELFLIIRRLREQGAGVVYISHRLEEIKQLTDRVTVMRDGRAIKTFHTPDVGIDQIISLMVGRTIADARPVLPETPSDEVLLEARGLNRGQAIKDVSFRVRRGEILGFAGLVGAGRTEVARAVFGADRLDSGTIAVRGREVRIASTRDAVRCGIGYLSEDRKRYGLALDLDVATNIALGALERFAGRLGWVRQRQIDTTAEQSIAALRIKTPGARQRVRYLSGGNQQKVVIGKWLVANTDILIFDEPTRGIDVGAKSEIYALLNDMARQGKAIVVISSELPEILRLCHRVIVMCEGRITGELPIGEASQERIMTFATQRGDLLR